MATKDYLPIRVLLADDHEIFRDGFRILLNKQKEIELIGEAEDGLELIQMVRSNEPDVIITDIKMPRMDGIDATRKLHLEYPHIGIIAFTMFEEDALIVDMLEAGAKGYLLKNSSKQEVFEAIKSVHRGEAYYCHHTTDKLTRLIAKSTFNPYKKIPRPDFTERELRVITLICQEKPNKEIAASMYLSIRTIEGYREKIQFKMGVRNTAGIVIYAIKNGLFKI